MKTFEKRVRVNFSQSQMYRLVADVCAYPDFLPWCRKVEILADESHGKLVRIGLRYPRLPPLSLTTKATFHPEDALHLRLVSGSFLSVFEGDWHFFADGEHASIVAFAVKYRFSSSLFRMTLAPFFNLLVTMLTERFIRRAQQIYPQR